MSSDLLITTLLIVALFVLLGSGVWIGLALAGVAWIGMELFSSRPAGDAMAVTIWGTASSWTLTALPLFVWMGEILFRTRLSEDMFKGLAPRLERIPGRLLHTNIIGCTIFAAVSGSSAATCATIGKMTLPELKSRGYPDDITIGTLAGAGTLGLLIPPSIIMIVYGVTAEVSITRLFIAGVVPGLMLAGLFMGYTIVWALIHPERIPPPDRSMRIPNSGKTLPAGRPSAASAEIANSSSAAVFHDRMREPSSSMTTASETCASARDAFAPCSARMRACSSAE